LAAHSDLRIRSSDGDYLVSVGEGGFASLMTSSDSAIVIDSALRGMVPPGRRQIIEVRASEDSKTLAGVEQLVLQMREAGVRRNDHVIAVGGGVVQDVATFATDIYMRGIDWTYVPTTLMAMADSCIGGKSSINVGGVKNLVGGFHPPDRVVVDSVFLASLPASAVAAGMAEAAKISFCRGSGAFEEYLEKFGRFDDDPADLLRHVLVAKQWFIEIDEHDRKERRQLNFGHTFGHALESAVSHSISHGAAVAVGILCAVTHPLSPDTAETRALAKHCHQLLADVEDLGDALQRFDPHNYEIAFRSDKKHSAGTFHLILAAPHGGVAEVEVNDGGTAWDAILSTTRHVLGSLDGRGR
jgi:3-dehydroquinate synthase